MILGFSDERRAGTYEGRDMSNEDGGPAFPAEHVQLAIPSELAAQLGDTIPEAVLRLFVALKGEV